MNDNEDMTDEEFLMKVVENIPEEACKRVHPKLIEKIKNMINEHLHVCIEYRPSFEDFLGQHSERICVSFSGFHGNDYNLETGDDFLW